MLRTILERISRGVVLKRRLPVELGGLRLLVSPDASLKYWRHDLRNTDAMLLSAAKALVRPGEVVWDVGANIGLFGFAAAGLAGKGGQVLVIEPDPWLVGLLRRSVELNRTSHCRIHVLPVAVGEQVGHAVLNIARRGRATNFVSGHRPSTQIGGIRGAVRVESVTLDGLLDRWTAPSVVKIDVEGAETSVLRGAKRLLRDIRPRIMCEVSEEKREEISDIFHSALYAMYDAENPLRESARIERCAWNTIALPAEVKLGAPGIP